MIKIGHISVSSIQQFDACPVCWLKKYIYHEKQPPYQPFIDGKLRHEEVDKYHTGVEYDKELIHNYTQIYPQDYRKRSEVKFLANLVYKDWISPLPFMGFIDGIRDGEIVDLKYAQSKPDSNKNLQGIVYSWLYYMKKGEFPMFTWNWWNKKNQKIQNVSVTYSESDIEWAINKIDQHIKDIQQPICILESLPARPFMNNHFPDCPNNK